MPLPIIPDNSIIQTVIRGINSDAIDMENVQYWIYAVGITPTVGGLTIQNIAANFLTSWKGLWLPFMSQNSTIDSVTARLVDSVAAIAPDRFKLTVTQQWSVTASGTGGVVSQGYPSFVCFNVQKFLFAGGRGRQGHVRIWGVPESSANGDEVDPGIVAAINAAIPVDFEFSVGVGPGTDVLQGRVMNGKLVNVNPGHIPSFYAVAVADAEVHRFLGSQLTRKFGRHRRA